jgi:hypothetical protein
MQAVANDDAGIFGFAKVATPDPDDFGPRCPTLSLLPDHFDKVAGISEEPAAIGAAAVDMLHVMLPRGVQVAGRWHEGPTLRPPPTLWRGAASR